MTLSEHLALRARERDEGHADRDVRPFDREAIRRLDALATCTCPACVRMREQAKRRQDVQGLED